MTTTGLSSEGDLRTNTTWLFLAIFALWIGHDLQSIYSSEIEKIWGKYIFMMVLWLSFAQIGIRSRYYKFSAYGSPIPIEDGERKTL